jgi:hypothetical protein
MNEEFNIGKNDTSQIMRFGIRPWIRDFLNGEGNNKDLLQGIEFSAKHFLGPEVVRLIRLRRIAGPEPEMVYKADAESWEETVNKYSTYLKVGIRMPPLIVVDFISQGLVVADGNKRYAALERAGIDSSGAIFCLREDPRTYNLT